MTSPTAYVFAPYRLLPLQRLLLGAGDQPVKLGGRAFDVLLALLERRERAVSKHELLDLVWPRLVVEENNLQVQMVALRKLLGHAAIATVPGRGYRFTLPVQEEGATAPVPAAAVAGAAAPHGGPTHNLPPWLPRLYGRDADLRTLVQLLQAQPQVTVTGSGGIGKTRLAQAAAATLLPGSGDGPWWVDLAPLSDPAHLADAVALALGLQPPPGSDRTLALQTALATRSPLIVLDNAEHLLEGVAALIALLRVGAPGIRWLVTSQQVLRLADEQVFRLEPLTLPDRHDPLALPTNGAVALFVARAQAAHRQFQLNAGNQATVADICRQLDGIPLALELAAARVPLLGVQGLHDRLDQRLQLLTSGERHAARRQHTLRAALEWSHQLLAAPEQAVLRRLAVFVGGFTLDSAQHVAADEQGIDGWDVLEHLGTLVDKSLVVVEGDAPPRYRMLETTRLFALERLIECGEAAAVRGLHRERAVALAETALPLVVAGDPRGLAQLDREFDNLCLALAWPTEDSGRHGLRLAAALRYYWTSRGLLARGLQAGLDALSRPGAEAPGAVRCTVLASTAQLCAWLGRKDEALDHARRALREARGLDDAEGLSLMLTASGFIHLARGEPAVAEPLAQEALALARTLGDGHALGNALGLTAALLDARGDAAQGRRMREEAVALCQRISHPWSEAIGRLNLAQVSINDGDAPAAVAHLRRVHALLPRVDSRQVEVHLLGIAGEWAALAGRHDSAVLLDAACAAQAARAGLRLHTDAVRAERLDRSRQALRAALCDDLQARGRALGADEAVHLAADLLSDPVLPTSGAGGT